MKKSMFLLGLAVAALASCTNEEVVNVTDQQTGVISFAGSGLNNITKADMDGTTLKSFQVYGGYETNGSLFNGTLVVHGLTVPCNIGWMAKIISLPLMLLPLLQVRVGIIAQA